METKSDSNEVDSGGGSDEIDKSAAEPSSIGNGSARKSISNGRNDRGMVSRWCDFFFVQPHWISASEFQV